MLLSRIPILLLSLIPSTLATQLVLTIPSSPQLPNPSVLPSSTYATLSTLSSVYTAPLSYTNAFSFRNLTYGSYLLTISSPTHDFVPYRIDIHVPLPNSDTPVIEAFTTFRGNEWSNKGESITIEKIGEDKFKAEVKVLGERGYYIERVGFSPLSLLQNPMILLAGFSMVLVFGMPYLMDNMDPELKAEFEERHKGGITGGGANPANPLQNFDAAAWLAGSSGGKKSEGGATSAERGITR
ncbi:ER membrane complex subunit protein [Rutstroemia sp. NJR-2017a BVV2]|nr:ER membrane complex subunit protein [Rutstroemia sp. NJR-2017a BVV2]